MMVICHKMTEMKENQVSSMCSKNKSTTTTTTTTTMTSTTAVLRGSVHHRLSRNMSVLLQDKRNTKQEFKRLKTILPSIRRKENVSKLDIILEAIKYIDDLQDQLIDRLSGPRSEREATLLALTTQESDNTDRLREFGENDDEMFFDRHEGDEDEEEDLISLSDGYMSDPGLLMIYQDQEDQEGSEPEDEDDCSSGISHASFEL
jgi:hypothetical protein